MQLLPLGLEIKGKNGAQLGIWCHKLVRTGIENRTLSIARGVGNWSLKMESDFHSNFIWKTQYIVDILSVYYVPSSGNIAVNKAKSQSYGTDIIVLERD